MSYFSTCYKFIIQLSILVILIVALAECTYVRKYQPDTEGLYVELGHHLFFEKNLSYLKNISCAHCHDPKLAFTDGYRLSHNANAQALQRNTPSLLNIEYRKSFNWTSPGLTSIKNQILGPLNNQHPAELGYYMDTTEIQKRLLNDEKYIRIFSKYSTKKLLNTNTITLSLEAYVKKLVSRKSKYDVFILSKDSSLFSQNEWKGYQIFAKNTHGCLDCHCGEDFYSPNIGTDFALTNGQAVRIPSLRNVAITPPFFHDGRTISLKDAIIQHTNGQKNENDNRYLHSDINNQDIKYILAFLETLTDTSYLSNQMFIEPTLTNI